MTPLVKIAMLGWFFAVVPALFIFLPKRTAAFSGLIFGWLLLPWAVKYPLIGPIDITRDSAVTLSVLACMVVFDPKVLLRLRPSWLDLPVAVWCISPFFTSISNGLGAYDGSASILSQLWQWGIPYIIGRAYVTNAQALRHLAMVLIVAAICYIPFILWEIRFSPQIHKRTYGYVTYDHGGTALRRLGGYRPLVFLRHGLMLGVFMAITALLAVWFWRTKSIEKLPLMPPGMRGKEAVQRKDGKGKRMVDALGPALIFWPVVIGLVTIAVLCRALNGMLLLAFGLAVLWALKHVKTRIPLVLFAIIPFAFGGLRMSESVTGFVMDEPVLNVLSQISEDRAGSVEYRFKNEHLLVQKALQRPLLGWGGWSRNRVYDADGNDMTVTDGLWIITLGQSGIIGFAAMFLTLLLPVFVLAIRFNARALCTPELAAASGFAVVLCMYAVDNLPNAMLNPMYVMAAGGLSGLLAVSRSRKKASSRIRRTHSINARTMQRA